MVEPWSLKAKVWAGAMLIACASPAYSEDSPNGFSVSLPNGFATVSVDDIYVDTTAGRVRWVRSWNGQEWKFNQHWESLSQSWKNLTGSQSADTTSAASAGATVSNFPAEPPSQSSSCWVWVDEDWEPTVGTVVVGGITEAGPMVPARSTPFNRLMGELAPDYVPLQRVSIDYANLCLGSVTGSAQTADVEALRRMNELYLGESGRYAFNNRAVLEKRAVLQILPIATADVEPALRHGRYTVAAQENKKGYRWTDRGGDWIEYNTQGQVVSWGGRNGKKVWLLRDAGGIVRAVLDDVGHIVFSLHYSGDVLVEVRDYPVSELEVDLPPRSVKYAYDDKNRLIKVTDVRGFVTQYEYDAGNRITKITDAELRQETIEYSGSTVKRHVTPDGAETEYTFDYDDVNKQFNAKVVRPETAAGQKIESYTHNRVGRMVRHVVNGRVEAEVRYDTGSRTESGTNARGFTTRTRSNEFEQVVLIEYPDGATVSSKYSAAHMRLLERVDAMGVVTQYDYDSAGNLLYKREAAGSVAERETEYVRNSAGLVTALLRRGKSAPADTVSRWAFDYDSQGNVKRTVDPEGAVRHYAYDRAGNPRKQVGPRGEVVEYRADASGNVEAIRDALGGEVGFTYDRVGNVVRRTDELGKTVSMAYDGMNRLTQTVFANGGAQRTQFNGHGFPVLEIDEDGRRVHIEYDNFQRLTKVTDSQGNVTTHGYGLPGDPTAVGALTNPTRTDYPGFALEQRFDRRERITASTVIEELTTGPDGRTTFQKYDKKGRVIETTNPEGKTTYFAYDEFDRVLRFTNSQGRYIELTWDAHDNIVALQDYLGHRTTLRYDRANRLVAQVLPGGQTTTYEYDASGNRTRITGANGSTIRHTYDSTNLVVRTEAAKAGETSPSLTYTYTRDAAGNLRSWSDGTLGAEYTYDDDGNFLSETATYTQGVSLGYAYTLTSAGLVKSLKFPDGDVVNYEYESDGLLGSIDIPGAGKYSVNSRKWVAPSRITLPGGVTREFSYDGLLQAAAMTVKSAGQQKLFGVENRYGRLSELLESVSSDAEGGASSTISERFAYDSEQRLTQATVDRGGVLGLTTEVFTFDAAGNRKSDSSTSGEWKYDSSNRLLQRGGTAYEYDATGNLVRKTSNEPGAGASVWIYEYDALNRLVAVKDGAGVYVAKYAYDPFDNRLIKDVYRASTGEVLPVPKRSLYLYAKEGLLAEAGPDGVVKVQYGWHPGGEWGTDPVFIKGNLLYGSGIGLEYAYFHNDQSGRPRRITDAAGQVIWRADYSIDGYATVTSSRGVVSGLRAPGQYFDQETGLHYNTRRYYDPVIGRYITSDPIGFAGGWNSYEYAGGDPINNGDPTGEYVQGIVRAINIAITVYELYTVYEEYKTTGCFDWTTLVPIPKWLTKTKWIKKFRRECGDVCECVGGNSFPGDTPVHVLSADGRNELKPISSIRVGDKVLARSEWKAEQDGLSYQSVTEVMTTPQAKRDIVRLTLRNGGEFSATGNHPIRTEEGWRDAVLIKAGDKLASSVSDAVGMEVVSAVLSSEVLTTYNLEVANAHTFFVGDDDGALVHNGRYASKRSKVRREVDERARDKQGKLRCEMCNIPTKPAKKSTRGVTPDDEEGVYHHWEHWCNGGKTDSGNIGLLCRKCHKDVHR